MEKTKRNKILIALGVLVALVVAFVLYFRFMPAWVSLQVVAGFVLGGAYGWFVSYVYRNFIKKDS